MQSLRAVLTNHFIIWKRGFQTVSSSTHLMLQLHKTTTVTLKRASLSFLNDALFTSLQALLQRYLRTGGEGGIRTHVGLLPNAFRVRPVMTTSIPLRVLVIQFLGGDYMISSAAPSTTRTTLRMYLSEILCLEIGKNFRKELCILWRFEPT